MQSKIIFTPADLNQPDASSMLLLQPRFGEVNVPLDAAQDFIGDGVFVAEL
jgi:hypothetical protein